MERRGLMPVAGLVALLLQCGFPSNPEAPSWDMRLDIPISDYTYSFEELLDETADVRDDQGNRILLSEGDTLFVIRYETQLPDTIEVRQKLEIDPLVKETYSQEIGDVVLELEEWNEVRFLFRDVYSQEGFEEQEGMRLPIPAVTFEDTSRLSIGQEYGFYRMLMEEQAEEGVNEIRFYIRNELPVDIANLAVLLLSEKGHEDFVTGEQKPPMSFISGGYAEDIPREMGPGDQPVEVVMPLYGRTIPRDVVFKLEGYTRQRGSEATKDTTFFVPVGLDTSTGEVIYESRAETLPADTTGWVEINEELLDAPIVLRMELSRLQAKKAEARIPEQRALDENRFDLRNPQMTIESATVAQGRLVFDVVNHLPVDAQVIVTVPGFGQPSSFLDIPRGQEGEGFVEFVDQTVAFPDTSVQELDYTIEVITFEEDRAILSNEDYIDITVHSEPFLISELAGYLGGKHDLPTISQALPLGFAPEGLERGMLFKEANLLVQFYADLSGSEAPVSVYLRITGKKEDGTSKSSVVEQPISQSGTQSILVPPEEAAELMSFLPDSLLVGGYVKMRKSEYGVFRSGDEFQLGGSVRDIQVHLLMPLTFKVRPTSATVGGIQRVELDDETQEMFQRNDVRKVALLGETTNHNPLSGAALVMVSTDSTSFDSTASLAALAKIDTLVHFNLAQPTFDASGQILQAGTGSVSVVLDSSRFGVFQHSPIFVKNEVVLDGTSVATNPEGWVFIHPAEDFVNIKTKAQIELKVDVEEITGD